MLVEVVSFSVVVVDVEVDHEVLVDDDEVVSK